MRSQVPKIGESSEARPNRGFSLIELLIVVAVILTIASIAIPSFIRSRMRAHEAAAVSNLRTITSAEIAYSTTYGIGYSTDLLRLGGNSLTADPTQAGLIDNALASGNRNGYSYAYTVVTTDPNGNVVQYSIVADPLNPGLSGQRSFYTDQTGVIRENWSASAGPSDPPIS